MGISVDGLDIALQLQLQKLEKFLESGAYITVGNKKYSIVNIVGGEEQTNNWGCVSIKVENA